MPTLRDHTTIDSRLYTRARSKHGKARFWADFRDFKHVGGGQEALVPDGASRATTDLETAQGLAKSRLATLVARTMMAPAIDNTRRTLRAFAAHHLKKKAIAGSADRQWLASAQLHLEEACRFFGPDTDLADVTVSACSEYMEHLSTLSNGRSGFMAPGTVTHYLNSLSSLFRRAVAEQIIGPGANPVAATVDRPKITRKKTLWLELPEMAEVLEFAKRYVPVRADLAIGCSYEIVAGYAYTGLRESELLGLEIGDVDLDRRVVHVQENEWRRLKTETSVRDVPIPTELHAVWSAYLAGPQAPTGRLFFPGRDEDGKEAMITDLRRLLDKMPMPERLRRKRTPTEFAKADAERLAMLARWEPRKTGPKPKLSRQELMKPVSPTVLPPLRTKMMRHTWCAARLQTLDGGKPIALYTVAQEMGHEDLKMIKKIYGHLGKIRHRGEEVQYTLRPE